MNDNLKTVQELYAAFGRQDVPAILNMLAEDVRWEEWPDHSAQKAGVPWLLARRGRQGAAEFFGVIANLQFHEFQVSSLLSNETEVVATVLVDGTWADTGVRMRDEEIHLWTFNADGKVSRFRHYCDTAKHMKAAGKG